MHLRDAIARHQPWQVSTGPRTAEGRAQSIKNGKRRQLGLCSVREVRSMLKEVKALIRQMRDQRRQLGGA
jgi:hypothetical protein